MDIGLNLFRMWWIREFNLVNGRVLGEFVNMLQFIGNSIKMNRNCSKLQNIRLSKLNIIINVSGEFNWEIFLVW